MAKFGVPRYSLNVFIVHWALMSQQKSPPVRKCVYMLGVTLHFEVFEGLVDPHSLREQRHWISFRLYYAVFLGMRCGHSYQRVPSLICSVSGIVSLYKHVLGLQNDVVVPSNYPKTNMEMRISGLATYMADVCAADIIRS